MNPTSNPGGPSPKPRASGCLKIFLGCAVVLGVLFVGSCLFSAGVGVYFITTPRQIDTEALIGDRTLAVVQVHADLEDPGVKGVMDAFFDAISRVQNQAALEAQLPAPIRALQQMGNSSNQKNLTWLFPVEGVVVVEPGLVSSEAGGAPEVMGALNLNHLPRIYARSLDWIAKIDDGAKRAAEVAMAQTLINLGIFDAATRDALDNVIEPVVLNAAGESVGIIRAAESLKV